MDELITDIRKALEADLLTLALVGALTLPDVCAALESPDGRTSGELYARWVDKNLRGYRALRGEDMWALRCGVLHQQRSAAGSWERVVFTAPVGRGKNFLFHKNVLDDALNLDLGSFCEDVIAAAQHWFDAHRSDPAVAENLPSMMQWHPDGMPPYFEGIPVLT
jgi:hypothetical protein